MTKSFRRTHNREPSAKRKPSDEFEHLNLKPKSRRDIERRRLPKKSKRMLLTRLNALLENFRQITTDSFSIPTSPVCQAYLKVDAEYDPSSRSMSLSFE